MSETKYPPVVMKWDTVVDHFLMLARNVFERGDKKAFFDAGAAEVNLKDFSKEEQIKIKKSLWNRPNKLAVLIRKSLRMPSI